MGLAYNVHDQKKKKKTHTNITFFTYFLTFVLISQMLFCAIKQFSLSNGESILHGSVHSRVFNCSNILGTWHRCWELLINWIVSAVCPIYNFFSFSLKLAVEIRSSQNLESNEVH